MEGERKKEGLGRKTREGWTVREVESRFGGKTERGVLN